MHRAAEGTVTRMGQGSGQVRDYGLSSELPGVGVG